MDTFLAVVGEGLLRVQSADEYMYTTTSTGAEDAAAGALGVGFIAIMCVSIVIGLAFLAFNIWMIVDVAKREFAEKTLWLVLLIAGLLFGFGWIVAIVYYFMVKKPMDAGKAPATAAPTGSQA